MILADTSIWIDHLRHGDEAMRALLERGRILIHPFVIGELALGTLRQRSVVLQALHELPSANVADGDEVLVLIERQTLAGKGIGYVDAHLLASVRLTPGAALWTRDKRLLAVADDAGLSASPA